MVTSLLVFKSSAILCNTLQHDDERKNFNVA